jgi:methylthioribose-1-phosphate isomerase
VRDLDQPVLRLLHLDALDVRAVRIQERRLREVLSIGGIAQKRERVVIDVFDVLPVERLEGLISS